MIGNKQKSLTDRAAEVIRTGGTSAELLALKTEIQARADELDRGMKAQQRAVDEASSDGLDAARAAQQLLADMRLENKVLHRQRSDLSQAIKIAKGQEAVKATSQHLKALAAAADKAREAQALLREAEMATREVVLARKAAREIGQSIDVDPAIVRDLAEAIHPPGQEREKFMRDLGIRPRWKAA